ncbi:MAG: PhoH family protein [Pseudomonadota bacterium]|jgi:phosphate starvation-inducible PhoH-like protein|nr:PhoH family protein [Pseudomonadota bacterium]
MGFIESSDTLRFSSNRLLIELCGQLDANLSKIESWAGVQIIRRGNALSIYGAKDDCDLTRKLITNLYSDLEHGKTLDERELDVYFQQIEDQEVKQIKNKKTSNKIVNKSSNYLEIKTQKKLVQAKSSNQNTFINSMLSRELVFGIGPAGTGKTYLAIAVGVFLFSQGLVEKIVLTRPAVEAGERLGFLPGDMKEKVDPYMQPLYDALNDFLPGKVVSKMYERGSIEIAPLAFMRGRTLKDSFIVLDEGQNASPSQMKMFLTRLGIGSRMVVTGDITQIDLPKGFRSGLVEASDVLSNIKEIDFIKFNDVDVVRHSLVRKIARAYEKNSTASLKSEK